MVKLLVQDYQIIKKAVINVHGLTLLQGQSNNGKSSFLRAIESAATNRFSGTCVRHGSDCAIVKFKFDDSDLLSVTRMQTGGSPVYKLNNNAPLTKLNRELPSEILSYFNLGSLPISSNENYSLNFFRQFQSPLLKEFSQKKVMSILSVSKSYDDLILIDRQLAKKSQELKGASEALSAIISSQKEGIFQKTKELESMSDLSNIESLFDNLGLVEKEISSIDELVALINLYQNNESSLTVLSDLLFEQSDFDKLNNDVELLSSLLQVDIVTGKQIGRAHV